MKQPIRSASTLAASLFALSAVASAQSRSVETLPPPRIPRAPVTVPAAPSPAQTVLAEPAEQPAVEAVAPIQRVESEPGQMVSVPMSDERFAQVYWDADDEGSTWVRGRNYKASFGRDGATYYPLFGSAQTRHYPLQLSLGSATSGGQSIPLAPAQAAVRDGERVVIDRGVIDEVYEIGVEGVEQTFVVGERPQGDLKLFVSLQSELLRSESEAGVEFANELGGVRYGRAFAREADGTKRALASRSVAGGVEIDVDAAYLATAQFPLVIDPIVSTFTLDGWFPDFWHDQPDVAYDATTDRYLYVFREEVAGEQDVFSVLRSASGTIVYTRYIDVTTDLWRDISVANLNAYDQFLVAGVAYTSTGLHILAKLAPASTLTWGPRITVQSHATAGGWYPFVSVGGDPYASGPSYYCVAWNGMPSGSTHEDVRARLVSSSGSLVGAGPMLLSPGGTRHDWKPSVSKGNGGTRWNVVWQAQLIGPPHFSGDIQCVQIEWDGSSFTSPIVVGSVAQGSHASVSAALPGGDYVVVWQNSVTGSMHDVFASRMNGATSYGQQSFTSLESVGTVALDQTQPMIDTDGRQFVVTYGETRTDAPLNSHVFATAFALLSDGSIGITEVHRQLSTGFPDPFFLTTAVVSRATSGGASGRFSIAWGDGDTFGAIYDTPTSGLVTSFCSGDGSGTACPCANAGSAGRGCANSAYPTGATLTGAGLASTTSDTLRLRATGLPAGSTCFFLQSTLAAGGGAGVPFNDGLKCIAGTQIWFATVAAGSGGQPTNQAAYPSTGETPISIAGLIPGLGATRYYQCWYTDVASFCTTSTTNTTNGVRVTWIP